jgi:hypothetical protein
MAEEETIIFGGGMSALAAIAAAGAFIAGFLGRFSNATGHNFLHIFARMKSWTPAASFAVGSTLGSITSMRTLPRFDVVLDALSLGGSFIDGTEVLLDDDSDLLESFYTMLLDH